MICYPLVMQLWAVPLSPHRGYWSSSECPSGRHIPWYSGKRPSGISQLPSLPDLIRRAGGGKKYAFSVTEVSLSPLKSETIQSESSQTKDSLFLANVFFYGVSPARPQQGAFWKQKAIISKPPQVVIKGAVITFPPKLLPDTLFPFHEAVFSRENLDPNVCFSQARVVLSIGWKEVRKMVLVLLYMLFFFSLEASSLDTVKLANPRT